MTPTEALAKLYPDGVPPRFTELIDHPDSEIRTSYSALFIAQATGKPMPSMPSLIRRVSNAGKAAVRFVASGGSIASYKIAAERLAICRTCADHYVAESQTCNHPDCGCYLPAKVKVGSESCPLGKWLAIVAAPSKCGGCGST